MEHKEIIDNLVNDENFRSLSVSYLFQYIPQVSQMLKEYAKLKQWKISFVYKNEYCETPYCDSIIEVFNFYKKIRNDGQ